MTTTTSTSTASTGASILTALNAGSGVDTATLVTNLTAVQKSSLEDGITSKQTANTAKVSAAASISSDIASFSSSLDTLIKGGTLMTQPTSSDTGVATATALPGARLGALSSAVVVGSLATAQTIQSTDQTHFSTQGGTLTIALAGGTSKDVTIAAGASIKDVAAAINAAGAGVTASVVTSGGTSVLVMKGATGTANGFTVSTTGSDSGLAALTYGGTDTDTMKGGTQAADAQLTIDGVAVTSASNTLTNIVQGVTLSLVKPGTISLTATRPTDAITGAVNDFVSAYNQLKAELDTATAAATSSTSAGALAGNSTIRDMRRQLAKLTTTPLIGNGTITTLAQLGVSTARDGTLSVDATMLSNALAKYPDDVEAMFNPAQSSSSSALAITSKVGSVASGVYSITGIAASGSGKAASASIDGVAATGSVNTMTAASGGPADGLTFTIGSNPPASATFTIDLGLGGALSLINTALTGSDGALTTMQATLKTQATSLSDQLDKAETALTAYHDRLVSQFSTMNTRVSAYKATQSYLTQQIDLWTKSTSS